MYTRNHLLMLVVGAVLLAGCQSLGVLQEEPRSEVQSPPATVERAIQVAMTIPRPRPPQAEAPISPQQLPEPGAPAPPKNLSFSQPNPRRQILDGPTDPPLGSAELGASPPSIAVPYIPDRAREFRLFPPVRQPEATVLAFAPSARALAGKEEPPRPSAAAPIRAAAPETSPPADQSGTQVARSTTSERTKITEAPAAPASPVQSAKKQSEVEGTARVLLARRGDPIAIDLEGSGWIYTGLRTGEEGVDFLSRQNFPNRTSFNFKAVDYGDYELTFQDQDHRQAVLRSQIIKLRVVPEQEFSAALQRQQSESSSQPESTIVGIESLPGPPIRSADALFDLGEYELALMEYKRNMRSGDPYLNDRLAECYERTGEYLAATKFYRENQGLTGEYGDRAALGLVRSSIATKDSRMLLEVLPSLFSLESTQIGRELLEVARFQSEDRHFSVAIQALEQYISRYPDGRNLDEVYYRLARIYEADTPFRDLESARYYYDLLYNSFPESRYSDPAAERLNYLNRHFFLVQ